MQRNNIEWPFGVILGLIVGYNYSPTSAITYLTWGIVFLFIGMSLVEDVQGFIGRQKRRQARKGLSDSLKNMSDRMKKYLDDAEDKLAKQEFSDEAKVRAKTMFEEQVGASWDSIHTSIQQRWLQEAEEDIKAEKNRCPDCPHDRYSDHGNEGCRVIGCACDNANLEQFEESD